MEKTGQAKVEMEKEEDAQAEEGTEKTEAIGGVG